MYVCICIYMNVYIHIHIHIYIRDVGKQLLQNLQVFLHDPVRDAQVILGSVSIFVLVILGLVFVFAATANVGCLAYCLYYCTIVFTTVLLSLLLYYCHHQRWLLSMCRLLWHCYGAFIHNIYRYGVFICILLTSLLVLLFFLESAQVMTVLHPTPCRLHPKLSWCSKLNCCVVLHPTPRLLHPKPTNVHRTLIHILFNTERERGREKKRERESERERERERERN